ncbi:flagellar motor switch protein FliG [Rhodovulum bhavnagarense]|uniref:Flagellar motor switch protein FliG n=1 Tax=Rhodovulum bhavnagarense TaxID=992286 RepID=A0A4R2RG75_9RHOB|nr:flagellar motor switch protein FliG [Rhodovulum bhavnagarense]TCP61379.1 flagellar motor switch protein FliG [Rhodovulum bhavnagarense]
MPLPARTTPTAPAAPLPGSLTFERLTGPQKVGILMTLFGEECAAEVLKRISPREVQELGTAMYSVAGVDHETVDKVLDEFLDLMRRQTAVGVGTAAYLGNMMSRALGEDRAQSVLGRITRQGAERPIEILDWMDPPSLLKLIEDEHPQIIATVIAAMDCDQAAKVLLLLPPEQQPDIVFRISRLNDVEPSALEELERVLHGKFKQNTTLRSSQIGGIKAAARIINHTKQADEQRILKEVRRLDRDLTQDILENMFVFENLVKSDDRALQTLLREVAQDRLVLALKGADETLCNRLLSCVSSRAAANIRDEMEALGPVKLSEVQTAQREITNVARRLADEGKIVLAGRGGEELI